jgi:hypothetical protein
MKHLIMQLSPTSLFRPPITAGARKHISCVVVAQTEQTYKDTEVRI